MAKKKKLTKYDLEIKKIKKIYQNYGINTDDMSDDELERLYHEYRKGRGNLEADIETSQKHSSTFTEDDIIG